MIEMSMQNINNNIAQSNELRDLKLKIQEFIIKVDIVLITALVNFFNEAVIKFLVLHYLNFV
jgi:hypothetical protein